jgi:competence protein ComEC
LIDHFQAIDPGFALSVGATAGILLLSPHLKSRLPDVLAIPISATIVCTPIIFALSGQFSLISIPANVLVSPVVAPITIFGFIAALIAPILPSISYIIVIALLPFAGWISFIAHHLSALPIINLPSSFMGAAIALLLLYILFKRLWLIAFLLAAVIGGFFFIKHGVGQIHSGESSIVMSAREMAK